MNKATRDLVVNFIIGGTITASISYLATFLSPILAAIWWAFPISLFPSMYYMHRQGKSNKYISKFTITTTYALIILFITTMALGKFFREDKGFWPPIGKTAIVWIILGSIYYGLIRKFDLEKYF